MERERYKDAEQGLKIAQILEGHIHRKVIKQTVMTTVYGVTRFGARLQIARQLKGKYKVYMKHIYPTAAEYDQSYCKLECDTMWFGSYVTNCLVSHFGPFSLLQPCV